MPDHAASRFLRLAVGLSRRATPLPSPPFSLFSATPLENIAAENRRGAPQAALLEGRRAAAAGGVLLAAWTANLQLQHLQELLELLERAGAAGDAGVPSPFPSHVPSFPAAAATQAAVPRGRGAPKGAVCAWERGGGARGHSPVRVHARARARVRSRDAAALRRRRAA